MNILVVAHRIPMQDRSAGSLRFFNILELLANAHKVIVHPIDLDWQISYYGFNEVRRHEEKLTAIGIETTNGSWAAGIDQLKKIRIDILFIEHYESVNKQFVEDLRFLHPQARIIVDTVDVAFNRLQLKAKITENPEDLLTADKVKEAELKAYGLADVVIGVSDNDAKILLEAQPGIHIEVIPLIYHIRPLTSKVNHPKRREILFVADFEHDANVDGILYFCSEVFPLIAKEIPDVRLRIIGASPPSAVRHLESLNIEVLGFVDDLISIYASSDISIAPMRYGGGLKGKIAEAMSFGIPVVSNSISLQGFHITAGKEALVGDDPSTFASGCVTLLTDSSVYDRVRQEGWNFVKANYSREAVDRKLTNLIGRLDSLPLRRLPFGKQLMRNVQSILERHVLWRFQ